MNMTSSNPTNLTTVKLNTTGPNTTKRLVDWFDTVLEALSTCFQWLPPGTGHFKVANNDVDFKYNSIPGDHFQVEWGNKYTVVYFLSGRARTPDRFVSLQTQVDNKIWVLSLDGLLRRDPLLHPNNTPNHPVLTQHWDTTGHWTEVRIDLSDAEFVAWKNNGHRLNAGRNAAHFPDQVSRAADHLGEVIDQLNHEYLLHGRRYADADVVTRMEHDLRNYARIDPDAMAEMVVNASLILPFCEAVRLHHKK